MASDTTDARGPGVPTDDSLCREIDSCRICGDKDLTPVISLGDQYIASLFPRGDLPPEVERAFPLDVVRCTAAGCGLVQLRHTVAPRVLYHHYGYRSGTNELMRANLAGIARRAQEIASLQPGDTVLDIGCNDGTLLKAYSTTGLRKVGIDPSDAIDEVDDPDIRTVNDFFSAEAFARVSPDSKARVVTTIAMFYDLDRPADFVADVTSVLADDGVWIIELQYLPEILHKNAFDTICHEHLQYYSLDPMIRVLQTQGLEIFAAELNDTNGGSIRVFVAPEGSRVSSADQKSSVEEIRRREAEMGLGTDAPYRSFRDKCLAIKEELLEHLTQARTEGKTVYAYGASTKGNTLLQFCGIGPSLVAKAADRNPDKWGSYTIGTNIPIVSEDEARAEAPDYFLALPWHFMKGFVKRESDYLAAGGRFLVPLPEVQVVGPDDG